MYNYLESKLNIRRWLKIKNGSTISCKLRPRQIRFFIQSLFLALILWTGWVFYNFYQYLLEPNAPMVNRPGAVEAFLPISALMALRQWIYTGFYDALHPAGLTILLLVILSALLFRRAFCSWVCPVGTPVEWIGRFGRSILHFLGMKPWIPRGWSVYLLSSFKYLILFFFVYVIWLSMNLHEIIAFLQSPYNQVADLKMLLFFLEPSKTTITVLIILFCLSMIIPNFWCRFACPYGALVAVVGKLSVTTVRRVEENCNDCGACQRACLNGLIPQKKIDLDQEQCTSCLSCVEACPRSALSLHTPISGQITAPRSVTLLAVGMLLIFFGGSLLAKQLGYWESILTVEHFRMWLPFLEMIDH
ncbi:4Fe-4S binding protein [Heliorestis acidaminivorans]|uniref:4Fe-4S binding protein n=1 Tax=Heliorestis acidaminivorans TaxID=553427 RepID=A0A6I0F4G9_9FIRM|nr:4Fe-4S binding protein [Heliorestis acidaminivorans]KAB2954650.1 4Fe-4S binding protein [Heliorestis acidaminivorans]